MPKKLFLSLFLVFYLTIQPICGQDMANWQEQILQQVDIDDLGDEAYASLIDELSDLTVWSDTTQLSLWDGRLRQHLIWNSNRCLNTRAGYQNATDERKASNKAYLGDPWHHSLRYNALYAKHWQMGINMEKDAGEAWRSRFPVFDSWHAYLRAKDLKLTEKLRLSDAVLGHYRLRMGCGLILNQGFSLGKQFVSQQFFSQRSNNITPFASNAEANYMQGTASSLQYQLPSGSSLSLIPYFSARQLDGTLNTNHILTALQTDGYHRTQTEESHRHAAWELVTGARLGYRTEWFDVGLHASYTQLQYDYRRSILYYNSNYFRGHQLFQTAFDYTIHAFSCWLKGEFALDDQGHPASIAALRLPTNDTWSFSLVHRHYSNKYRQLHASSLRESSSMQGEQGITLNASAQISRHWNAVGMFDLFHFSQPQYAIRDSTSSGYEGLLRLNYTPNHSSFSLAYRIRHKPHQYRHTFDALFSIQPLPNLSCKTQARARIYNKENPVTTSLGYLLSQSISYQDRHWTKVPFRLDLQVTYFKTDDYDSRVYLTERPLLYSFSIPMLFGQGLHYSLTSTIKIGPSVSLDLKYALTNYANRSSISTGLQQISGNTQHDLLLQLRLTL